MGRIPIHPPGFPRPVQSSPHLWPAVHREVPGAKWIATTGRVTEQVGSRTYVVRQQRGRIPKKHVGMTAQKPPCKKKGLDEPSQRGLC
jgi:hypothetical protein